MSEYKPLLFTEFESEEQNVLASAVLTAARENRYVGRNADYEWLEAVSRKTFAQSVVAALKAHGYYITRIPFEISGPNPLAGVNMNDISAKPEGEDT